MRNNVYCMGYEDQKCWYSFDQLKKYRAITEQKVTLLWNVKV